MTTIGFIGSGRIGATVAGLAVSAGYSVVMSNSRGPHTLVDVVAELGDAARAGSAVEAATDGDLVVVSIPFGRIGEVPATPLAGKVVIDTNNYYAARDGNHPDLDRRETTSAERLQRQLPGAHVVKVFNNIHYRHLRGLARPDGAPDRTALPIAGDHDAAKAAVAEFLDRIGFDAYDVGGLAEGWRYQPDTPAYGTIYFGPDGFEGPGRPAGIDELARAVAAAR